MKRVAIGGEEEGRTETLIGQTADSWRNTLNIERFESVARNILVQSQVNDDKLSSRYRTHYKAYTIYTFGPTESHKNSKQKYSKLQIESDDNLI